MLTLHRLRAADDCLFAFAEKLLTQSFPAEEYRPIEEWRHYTSSENRFHNQVIMEAGKPIGLVAYWDFEAFRYIEHLATIPEVRGGGYGLKLLQLLQDAADTPIVLEVEEPTDDLSTRRIGFYRRAGFELWEKTYLQPPYRKGDGMLPMYLMVWGRLSQEQDFEQVKDTLYQEVYHYGAK